MKRKYIFTALLCCSTLTTPAQEDTQNYIRTSTMLDESRSRHLDKIEYFDGLGRPFQTVLKKASGSGSNLVTLQEYDAAGRATCSWLPIVSSSEYIAPATFKGSAPGNYGNDPRPYSQSVYEASPLNRIAKQYGPGAAWHSGHPVSTGYLTNSTANASLNCLRYGVDGTGTLTANGSYASGELYVQKTTDEDGNVSYTFTDKQGHMVLTRQMKGSEAHDTYYVYDDKGNLRFVLQPMYQTTADLEKHAFQYKYDGRGNCIRKKLPGAQHILYEYDAADRLTFSQDGNQRALTTGNWTYYKYDNLNRLAEQGICTNKVTASGTTVHVKNYYDDYSFVGTAGFTDSRFTKDTSGYGKGMLTGQTVYHTGICNPIRKAFYYDIRGREVKRVETNVMDGYEVTETTYTFTDQPKTVTHTHTSSKKPTLKEVYTYSYDHADRISKVEHKLDSGATVTLAEYSYDELGRLSQKKVGGTAHTSTYAYNIRNWLTGISGAKFTQNLYYNTGNGTARYNGNISSMTWKAGNESILRGYKFTYDGLDRMLNATYGEGASINTNANRFSENVTAYDKNGNITGLQRYGQTATSAYGLVDNLTYTLSGNQLNRVDDAATASAYNNGFEFKDGVKQANEYTYDNNGNLTKDLNAGVSNIQYNCLNLPQRIDFSAGGFAQYGYTMDGVKRRKQYMPEPGSRSPVTIAYCGNVVYEESEARILLTEEGYVTLDDGKYHYYLQDHQGNNRVVISENGTVEETNHYYPFGGMFAGTNSIQPYKYNGKEMNARKELKWYDYGARHYDAALGRFTTVDPSAESYYEASLYAYCGNNPANRIDPDGMDWYKSEDGLLIWRSGSEENLSGYTNIGACVSIQLGEDSYVNFYQNGGIKFNQAANAFDLIASSVKLQKQFLGKNSPLSEESKSSLFNSLVSRSVDAIARPIGETIVGLAAGELAGAIAGKALGWAVGKVAGKAVVTEINTIKHIETANGINVTGFTKHGVHRAIERGVKPNTMLDALKNPLKIGDIVVDKFKRSSQRFVGRYSEVVINPKTGQIISTNPTSSAKAAKLLKK